MHAETNRVLPEHLPLIHMNDVIPGRFGEKSTQALTQQSGFDPTVYL